MDAVPAVDGVVVREEENLAVAAHVEHPVEEEEYVEPNHESMFTVQRMLYRDVEIDGQMCSAPIEYLTLETARAIVEKFREPGALHDDERAHSNEDKVNEAFIRGVALGKYTLEEAREIAQLILEIGNMPFHRWCA